MHGHSPEQVRERLARPARASTLRDAVYGGMDGAVTTLAIVTGVAGAGLPHVAVLALGIANVLADGFSMAAGDYVATQSERENVARLRAMEEEHVRRFPEGERLELRAILERKGYTGRALEEAVTALSARERLWIDLMLVEEHGVTPITGHPMRAAVVTLVAFLACGLVPLAPYLLASPRPLTVSVAATLAMFALIGAVRSRWTLRRWWRCALESLGVGAVAGSIAWIASVSVARVIG